jgi:hypothetical protein
VSGITINNRAVWCRSHPWKSLVDTLAGLCVITSVRWVRATQFSVDELGAGKLNVDRVRPGRSFESGISGRRHRHRRTCRGARVTRLLLSGQRCRRRSSIGPVLTNERRHPLPPAFVTRDPQPRAVTGTLGAVRFADWALASALYWFR